MYNGPEVATPGSHRVPSPQQERARPTAVALVRQMKILLLLLLLLLPCRSLRWLNHITTRQAWSSINPLDGRFNDNTNENDVINPVRDFKTRLGSRPNSAMQVFINPKSGGRFGQKMFGELTSALDEAQICNLNTERPVDKLISFGDNTLTDKETAAYNNTTSKLANTLTDKDTAAYNNTTRKLALCCGGDGTARWIMDETKKLNLSSSVAFGLMPLGTGNDLFNHFVSQEYSVEDAKKIRAMLSPKNLIINTDTVLSCFEKSSCTSNLDRWRLIIQQYRPESRASEIYESPNLR